MLTPSNPLTLAGIVSVWLAGVCNWPLWRSLVELPELQSLRGLLFILSFALAIASFNFALLALGAWQHSIKPLATLLLVVAAVCAHFMGRYRIVIDPTMIAKALHTNGHEAADLVDWNLLLSMAWMAGLPAWWLWRKPLAPMPAASQALHNAAALSLSMYLALSMIVLNAASMSSIVRNHKMLQYMINPANLFYALARLAL